jgi:hypothetical protein
MGHRVDGQTIVQALADEWFPLAHEGEFLSVVHLALMRCRAEAAARQVEELGRSHVSPNERG